MLQSTPCICRSVQLHTYIRRPHKPVYVGLFNCRSTYIDVKPVYVGLFNCRSTYIDVKPVYVGLFNCRSTYVDVKPVYVGLFNCRSTYVDITGLLMCFIFDTHGVP